MKAKANKHKKVTVIIEKSPKANMDELDAAIRADREALGKKPFDKKDDDEPPTSQIQQSKTIRKVASCTKKANRMAFITVSTVP